MRNFQVISLKRFIVMVFVCSLVVPLSHAQDTNNFYVGAGIGHADQKDSCDDIAGSCDDTDTGWKLFVGYKFNSYVSAEGGYIDFGESDADDVVLGIPVSAEAEVDGFFLTGIASWPLYDKFNIFGKIGVLFWDVDVDASGGGTTVSDDETGTDIMFGLGAEYIFTNKISARVEWEHFNNVGDSDIGDTDIDLISGSILFRF